MGVGTQTPRAKLITSQNAPITNLSIPLANTEYSLALQNSLKKVIIRCRGDAKLQLTFVSGETNTKYFTIEKNNSLELSDLDLSSTTLYVRSDKASQIVEIWEFY